MRQHVPGLQGHLRRKGAIGRTFNVWNGFTLDLRKVFGQRWEHDLGHSIAMPTSLVPLFVVQEASQSPKNEIGAEPDPFFLALIASAEPQLILEGETSAVINTFAVASRIWHRDHDARGIHAGARTPGLEFLNITTPQQESHGGAKSTTQPPVRLNWDDFPVFPLFADAAGNHVTITPDNPKDSPFGLDGVCRPFLPNPPPPLRVPFAFEFTNAKNDNVDEDKKDKKKFATVPYDIVITDILDLDKATRQYFRLKKDGVNWTTPTPEAIPTAFDLFVFRTDPVNAYNETGPYELHAMGLSPETKYAVRSFYPHRLLRRRGPQHNLLPTRVNLRRLHQLVRLENADVNPLGIDCTPRVLPPIKTFVETEESIRWYNEDEGFTTPSHGSGDGAAPNNGGGGGKEGAKTTRRIPAKYNPIGLASSDEEYGSDSKSGGPKDDTYPKDDDEDDKDDDNMDEADGAGVRRDEDDFKKPKEGRPKRPGPATGGPSKKGRHDKNFEVIDVDNDDPPMSPSGQKKAKQPGHFTQNSPTPPSRRTRSTPAPKITRPQPKEATGKGNRKRPHNPDPSRDSLAKRPGHHTEAGLRRRQVKIPFPPKQQDKTPPVGKQERREGPGACGAEAETTGFGDPSNPEDLLKFYTENTLQKSLDQLHDTLSFLDAAGIDIHKFKQTPIPTKARQSATRKDNIPTNRGGDDVHEDSNTKNAKPPGNPRAKKTADLEDDDENKKSYHRNKPGPSKHNRSRKKADHAGVIVDQDTDTKKAKPSTNPRVKKTGVLEDDDEDKGYDPKKPGPSKHKRGKKKAEQEDEDKQDSPDDEDSNQDEDKQDSPDDEDSNQDEDKQDSPDDEDSNQDDDE